MKRVSLFLVLALLAIAMIGTTAVAFAHNGEGRPDAPGGPGGRGIGGQVTAIDGDTLTVESPRGSATIVTTADTAFTVNGEDGSLSDISVGMFAGARGDISEDGSSVTADSVMASDEAPQRPEKSQKRPGIGGQITAIDGSTLTVESPRGTATIVTTADTAFTVNGEDGSLSDISVGMFAGARGDISEDGSSVTADHVMASDEAPQRPEKGEGRPGPGGSPNRDQ